MQFGKVTLRIQCIGKTLPGSAPSSSAMGSTSGYEGRKGAGLEGQRQVFFTPPPLVDAHPPILAVCSRFGWFGIDPQGVPKPTLNYIGTAVTAMRLCIPLRNY